MSQVSRGAFGRKNEDKQMKIFKANPAQTKADP
jgi:hypothetical protein